MKNFRRNFLLLTMIAGALTTRVDAAPCACSDCSTKAVMGKVQKIKMEINRLYVLDDFTKEVFDFFVHDNVLKALKEGEYVRVYYQCLKEPALHVEKMTPTDYNDQNQNKGYLHKKD